MQHLSIGPTDRVALFGMTGTGKTTRARLLLAACPRTVILDPKGTYHDGRAQRVTRYERRTPHQLFRAGDDRQAYEDYLSALWRDGQPCVVYVDEVADLASSSRVLSRQLSRAIREGREVGIRVWSATQRPADIPSVIFTEADHIWTFYLSYEGDREKVQRFTTDGMADRIDLLRGHDSWYFSHRIRSAIFVPAEATNVNPVIRRIERPSLMQQLFGRKERASA
jgi:hypothetical protein